MDHLITLLMGVGTVIGYTAIWAGHLAQKTKPKKPDFTTLDSRIREIKRREAIAKARMAQEKSRKATDAARLRKAFTDIERLSVPSLPPAGWPQDDIEEGVVVTDGETLEVRDGDGNLIARYHQPVENPVTFRMPSGRYYTVDKDGVRGADGVRGPDAVTSAPIRCPVCREEVPGAMAHAGPEFWSCYQYAPDIGAEIELDVHGLPHYKIKIRGPRR